MTHTKSLGLIAPLLLLLFVSSALAQIIPSSLPVSSPTLGQSENTPNLIVNGDFRSANIGWNYPLAGLPQ